MSTQFLRIIKVICSCYKSCTRIKNLIYINCMVTIILLACSMSMYKHLYNTFHKIKNFLRFF
nr:MAG TPA: hypothetical protein [Caudoviricetes sp.]